MSNRRTFVKQLSAASLAGSMPFVFIPEKKSPESIKLLVRADDFGNSWGRTAGIIKTYKEGIVTSTSLIVPSQFFEESVSLCKANPGLAVGLHITLVATRTRPVLSPEIVPSIVNSDGFFYESMAELEKANPKAEEIEKEIRAQVGKARASGLHFVYLDWHRGGSEQLRVHKLRKELILQLCKEQKLIFGEDDGTMYGYLRYPFIPEHWPTIEHPDGQRAHYAAPSLSENDKKMFFERLNNIEPGKWLSVAHPGLGEPERLSVVELLCTDEAKHIIKRKNIQLVSYFDLWKEEFKKNS